MSVISVPTKPPRASPLTTCIRVLKHAGGKSWEGLYKPGPTLWNGQTHWSKNGKETLFFENLGVGGSERAWQFTTKETNKGKVNFYEGGWIPPVMNMTTGTWVPTPPLGSHKWIYGSDNIFSLYDTEIDLSLVRCGEIPKYVILTDSLFVGGGIFHNIDET